jgi:hypothetical protein
VVVVALWSSLGLAGCLVQRPDTDEEKAEDLPTLLSVENRHWSNVTIYVMRGGARARIGTVTSMRTETFVIPAVLVGSVVDLRLIADPLGGEPYVSDPVIVGPGERIDFRLANILVHSSISIRRH